MSSGLPRRPGREACRYGWETCTDQFLAGPVAAAIDLAAQALMANVRVTHPVVLGRLLLLLAPLLDPRFPMRATRRP